MSCGSAPAGVRLRTSTERPPTTGPPMRADRRRRRRSSRRRSRTSSRSPRPARASECENDSQWSRDDNDSRYPLPDGLGRETRAPAARGRLPRRGAPAPRSLEYLAHADLLPRRPGDLRGARSGRIGLASVYRMLDRLDEQGLVQRIDIGDGIVRYEPDGRGDITTTSSAASAARWSRSRTSGSSRRSRRSRSGAATRSSRTRSCCAARAPTVEHEHRHLRLRARGRARLGRPVGGARRVVRPRGRRARLHDHRLGSARSLRERIARARRPHVGDARRALDVLVVPGRRLPRACRRRGADRAHPCVARARRAPDERLHRLVRAASCGRCSTASRRRRIGARSSVCAHSESMCATSASSTPAT